MDTTFYSAEARTAPQNDAGNILNLTQHSATAEQLAAGVSDLPAEVREELSALLTFEDIPSSEVLRMRSIAVTGLALAEGAKPGTRIMVGGAPFFMEELCHSLRVAGLIPVFAFSRRESVEQAMPDGSVRKVAVFRHLGFVEPDAPRE